MLKGNKNILVLVVLMIAATLVGATFAYWFWQSGNANKTNVIMTVSANFTCSANGGGDIASASLAPASCTNSLYAIQRTITTNISNTSTTNVSMDLWLLVNEIDSSLANSANFKWALTKNSASCSSNLVNTGTFQGKTANSTVTLFTEATSGDTYYLYIWLDNNETSTTTMNKYFSLSLGGACSNSVPGDGYVYTVNNSNIYGVNHVTNYGIAIGEAIDNSITVYSGQAGLSQAINHIYEASNAYYDYKFFLMHKLENSTVTESHVGFVITPSLVTAAMSSYTAACNSTYNLMGYSSAQECINDYSGATAGTYTIQGNNLYEYYAPPEGSGTWVCSSEHTDTTTGNCDSSQYYSTNMATLLAAFGESNCIINDYSRYVIICDAGDVRAIAKQEGEVSVFNWAESAKCIVDNGGGSGCDYFVEYDSPK